MSLDHYNCVMNFFFDLKYSGSIWTCHKDVIVCYYTVKCYYNSVMNNFLDLNCSGTFMFMTGVMSVLC